MEERAFIALSHMGYLTEAPEKRAYLINPGTEESFSVRAVETRYISGEKKDKEAYCPVLLEGTITVVDGDFGSVGIMDFSEIRIPGLYQITVGDNRSHPFFIRKDLYLRTAYEAFYYSHIQRCGGEVEGWHRACHMDDGILDSTGEHVDCTGGWHDAGDLRKLLNHTLWHAKGMIFVKRAWGVRWTGYSDDDILDELRHGNSFYLKARDPETDLVWSDVGANERDNTWTDGIVGTEDDRMINTRSCLMLQRKYSWIQAMIAELFADVDTDYSRICLRASVDTYQAAERLGAVGEGETLAVTCGLLAAVELLKATGDSRYLSDVRCFAEEVLIRQELGSVDTPSAIRGYFYNDATKSAVFNDWWQGCLLPFSLFFAADVLDMEFCQRIQASLRSYVDDFILPLSERNPFGAIPVCFENGEATHDQYRCLGDGQYYRYFLSVMTKREEPERFREFGQGTNTHLLGNAAVLFRCARVFGEERYRTVGLRLLEWVHGANPLGFCMVTGRGAAAPYPHSRYLGLITGAILNGISGDERDIPRLGGSCYDLEWQTVEYWSPTQAQYLMALCELHDSYSLKTDIGVRGPFVQG